MRTALWTMRVRTSEPKGSPDYVPVFKERSVCGFCNGKKDFSECCGGSILMDQLVPACSECFEQCSLSPCPDCKGEGTIEE